MVHTSRLDARHLLAGLLPALAAVIIGCGGGSSTTTPAATATPTPDTTAPTLIITPGLSADETATGPVTFMFAFSEAVSGFTTAAIDVTNCTKGALTQVSASAYTLVVTPAAGSGIATVSVAANKFNDLANNANTASASGSVTFGPAGGGGPVIDTTAPTVAITSALNGGSAVGPTVLTFAFSEPVATGYDSKIVVTNGTKGTFTPVNAMLGQLVVTPKVGTGRLTASIAAGNFVDAAGNASTAGASIDVDYNVATIAPTLAITTDAPVGGAATGPVTFTFTSNKSLSNDFTEADVSVMNGTKGAFTRVSSTVSTLVVTPPAGVGSVSVSVPAEAFTAADGTPNNVRFWSTQLYALPVPQSTAKSPKRGLAYNLDNLQDLTALAPGVSWWYNWSPTRSANISAQQAADNQMDFVPMVWGSDFDAADMEAKIEALPNAKFLLVLNEPNFPDQSRTHPTVAAANWPKYEALAQKYNLQIVGPAMNFSGDANFGDPVFWMDAFLAAYREQNGGREPQIDAIALHWYDYGMEFYLNKFAKYGKALWVTEFANWHTEQYWVIDTPAKQIAEGVTPMVKLCEDRSDVARYSWFTGRWANDDHSIGTLAATTGQLTQVGAAYVAAPFNTANKVTIPTGPSPLPTLAPSDMTILTSRVAIAWPIWKWRADWSNSAAAFTDSTASLAGDGSKIFKIDFIDAGMVGMEDFYWALDATDRSTLHIDYWTGDGSELRVKLVDFGADYAYQGTGENADSELEKVATVSKNGCWQSFDLDFSALAVRKHIKQIVLYSPKKSTWYLDNIYLYKPTAK